MGPDDRGTLWIEFYKVGKQRQFWGTRLNDLQRLPEGYRHREQLQFVIWISSMGASPIAFDDIKTVKQGMTSPMKLLSYQPLNITKRRTPRRRGKKNTEGKKPKVTLFTVVIVEWMSADCHLQRGVKSQ